MRFVIFFLFLIFLNNLISFSQVKQTNLIGSDILAEAPWRMKKTDSSGNVNGIPLHVFIKDADDIGNNAELIYVNIYLKNAVDTLFGNPINFNTYTDSAFSSIFSSKSQTDAVLDIQSFDASLPVKDSYNSIMFTADDCVWPDVCTYVDITHQYWYFTITIPSEKLAGLNDIIDIKVEFSLNWQTDVVSYLRVFRYNENFPKLSGWYRGDSHYHTMYTTNTAEYGLPLSSTKEVAKEVGLDWVSITDHSCDYDNYGAGIQSNWSRREAEVQSLNMEDTSMIFIAGSEVSVNNSAENIIHLLCYPSPDLPYLLPYLGDGNGDVSSTSLNINDILFTLSESGGFAYASHPFASGDKLSSLVDGGIWNVGDTGYFDNGTSVPGYDQVVCNDLSYTSDVYSLNPTQMLFKNYLLGGEIWNFRNGLFTTDEIMDPWNDNYDSDVTGFAPYNIDNSLYHYNRLLSNFEASKFFWRKGLIEKNANPSLQNYRFYISAGSDAHGDFNYSNTNYYMGLTADINEAAIGKPSMLVYCPQGMGSDGGNILSAMENGNILISDGPLVSIGISTDEVDSTSEFIPGQAAFLDSSHYFQSKFLVDLVTTPEFGLFNELKIMVGTENGEYTIPITVNSSLLNTSFIFNLDSLVQEIILGDSILGHEYFYFRAELSTYKDFGSQAVLYAQPSDTFHCYTNPIWIRKPFTVISQIKNVISENLLQIFPNPAHDILTLEMQKQNNLPIEISVFDLLGNKVYNNVRKTEKNISITIQNLPSGVYYISVKSNEYNAGGRFVKY